MSTRAEPAIDLRPGEASAVARAPRKRRFSRAVREAGLGYMLLLPAFLIFSVFVFYPFLRNFYLGFFSTPPFPGQPKNYVGLDQYKDVLSSSDFLDSLKTTITFAIITVPIGIALGILLAVLAHQKLQGIALYRTFFSSTVATSIAVAAVIFGTLLSPQVGLLQGIQTEPSILQNPSPLIDINLPVIRSFIPSVSLTAVAVTTIWQNLGLSFILMSAGLQAVPDELQEAAEIDGAGPWRRFRAVTWPLLAPSLTINTVVLLISAFKTYDYVKVITNGGPGSGATATIAFGVLQTGFDSNHVGYASAMAVVMLVIVAVLTTVVLNFLRRREVDL